MKKLLGIKSILFILLIINIIVGMISRKPFFAFISLILCVLFGIMTAMMEIGIYAPIQQAVYEILDEEEETIAQKNLFIKSEHNSFLKNLNLAVYKYENSKKSAEGAEAFQKQTELMALQSQINPHFLYNTLDTIRGQALINNNPQVAEMVEKLSMFFRYSISGKENMVMLRDELNHTINYIAIQQFRFGNRFVFDVEIDDEDKNCMNYLVPRLILQPIVENAIFHGLEDVNEGGRIALEVTLLEDELIITISDNGKGMPQKALDDLNDRIHSSERMIVGHDTKSKDHTGIALPNINRRIKLMFGDAYGMSVFSSVGMGTDVELVLPVIDRMEEE